MNRIIIKFMFLTGIFSTFFLQSTWASDLPRVDIQVRSNLLAGWIPDGMRLATVRISLDSIHNGFLVWSDAQLNGTPGHYLLEGRGAESNTKGRIRVRLEGSGWQPDRNGGRGMVSNTTASSTLVDVVSDGGQTVTSDRWVLQIQAVGLMSGVNPEP